MARLIDGGAAKGDLDYVINTGLIMLLIAGAGAVFAMTRNISASYASHGFGADLRRDMFAKIQSLSVEDMDKFEGGSLVTRMTNDITQTQNFVNGMMRIFFKAPIMCVGAVIMAATLNFKAVPIVVPVIIAAAFIIALGMKLTFPKFEKVQKSLDKLNTTMREYLAGIRLVKAFRRFDEEEKRFSLANNALAENSVKAVRILAVLSPMASLCVNLGVAAIIFFGASWVELGEIQVGQIMAFITYMTQIMNSLGMIANVLNMFVRVKTSHERIREVFETGATPTVNADALPPPSKREALREPLEPLASLSRGAAIRGGCHEVTGGAHIIFDNVNFSYKGSTGQAALSGLNFSVGRGETLGVIGPTGSGKSTLAALLMRFYGVSDGEIRVSNTPVENIPESDLRSKIAIVPQTASLFTGAIRDNILWGKETASDFEIEEAAKTAEAHEFITASPGGYNTIIGQHGVNLSGGQKQRVSIARALIRNPEILVLDDCTSALDVMTEAKVKRAIRKLPNNMTCVLITQRVNTVMTCDKILVLDSGRQAGFGSHEDLMADCGVYRDIYMSQIGREEDNGK
jgi:ATP-binding cassette subfamily B protein